MKKTIFYLQSIIQFLVALGALIAGVLMMIDPSGAVFQFPPDTLKNTPFDTFLVPGIILFAINGVGQLIAGILTIRRHPLSPLVGAIFGFGLMIWIFVQVNMIGGGYTVQYVYFFIGVVETALAFLLQKIPCEALNPKPKIQNRG